MSFVMLLCFQYLYKVPPIKLMDDQSKICTHHGPVVKILNAYRTIRTNVASAVDKDCLMDCTKQIRLNKGQRSSDAELRSSSGPGEHLVGFARNSL